MGSGESSTTRQSIQHLKKLSLTFLENALAPTTKRNYRSAKKNYDKFCNLTQVPPFPPTEDNLILYVTELATHSSHSNIKMHLAAIRYYSIHYTSNSPIQSFQRLYYLLKGIKRSQGNSRKKLPRAPVTPSILVRIHASLFSSMRLYEDKVMIWSALLLAFFGFLRVSEYTSSHKTKYEELATLLLSDVSLGHGHLNVNIKASKTDPFREGVMLRIAKNGSLVRHIVTA